MGLQMHQWLQHVWCRSAADMYLVDCQEVAGCDLIPTKAEGVHEHDFVLWHPCLQCLIPQQTLAEH